MTYLCKTCGTQFPPSDDPPARCPICEDERQYIPAEGNAVRRSAERYARALA